ncbi:MAG: EAL domain-containing protein [Acidobacteriota bacterium]
MITPPSGALALGRVLIADDDDLVRLVASEALTRAGFQVFEASDGREALSKFLEVRPHVVMLDVEMPEMDGHTACAEIRQAPGGRDTPIMMLTGKDDILSIERAYEAGATDFTSKPVNWLVVAKRVTYLRRSGQLTNELRERRQQLEEVHRLAGMGHWAFDPDKQQLRCSRRAMRILGLEQADLALGIEALTDRVASSDLSRVDQQIDLSLAGKEAPEIEFKLEFGDGRVAWIRQRVESQSGAGKPGHVAGIVQDVSRERSAEERADYLARYDRATGLANRQNWLKQSDELLKRASHIEGQAVIATVGLAEVREIRMSLGDAVAEKVLEISSERLKSAEGALRDQGYLVQTGRCAEDEFAIAVAPTTGGFPATQALGAIERTLRNSASIGEHSINLAFPIGVALHPDDGPSSATLLQSAGEAMRNASRQTCSRLTFVNPHRDEEARRSYLLRNDLHIALERSELGVAFQPQLRASDGFLIGVEALARWHHETLGHISPATFIPLAEEAGLIQEIGQFVFEQSCQWLETWSQQGLDLRIAVNLSSRQFSDPGLAERLLGTMERHGIAGERVEIEITESVVLDESPAVGSALERLRSEGLKIAIDDFGVGHSSLRSVAGFPFDTIKLDRSFVQGIPDDEKKMAIVRTILAMARSLGMRTVSEGVENATQWAFLRDISDEVQGFHFSKPIPPQDLLPFAGKRFSVPA